MNKYIVKFSVVLLLATSSTFAAQLDWAPGTPPAYGGSGDWQDGGATWTNDGSNRLPWNNANNDIAKFEVGPGTVNVIGGVTASQIYFGSTSSSAYTFVGAQITLSGNGDNLIEGDYGGTNVISNDIFVSNGNNQGTFKVYNTVSALAPVLTLNGNISFNATGNKTVRIYGEEEASTITFNGAIGAAPGIMKFEVGDDANAKTSAVYNFNGTSAMDANDVVELARGTINLGDPGALGSSTIFVGKSLTTATHTAKLNFASSGTVANSIVTSNAGASNASYIISSDNGVDATVGGTVSILRNTVINVGTGGRINLSGELDGNSIVTKEGAGMVLLSHVSGNNAYAGEVVVNAGSFLLNINGDYALKTKFTVNSGGTFGGDGHLNDLGGVLVTAVVNSGGTIAGGYADKMDSSLRIDGNLTIMDGGHIALTLGEGLASTQLVKSGGGSVWTLGSTIYFDFGIAGVPTTGTYEDILDLPGFDGGAFNFTGWTVATSGIAGTFVWDNAGHVDFISTAMIPEPAPIVLIGFGLGTVLFFRRRRS